MDLQMDMYIYIYIYIYRERDGTQLVFICIYALQRSSSRLILEGLPQSSRRKPF